MSTEQPPEQPVAPEREGSGPTSADPATTSPRRPPQRPDYVRFAVTGAVAGLVVAAVLAVAAPSSDFSTRQVFLYAGLIFAFLGALAAAGLAVLIEDRVERRRSTRSLD